MGIQQDLRSIWQDLIVVEPGAICGATWISPVFQRKRDTL